MMLKLTIFLTVTLVCVTATVHRVADASQMNRAITAAGPGDTIVITRTGNYGRVLIRNKRNLRFTPSSSSIVVTASFTIYVSSDVSFERLNLIGVRGQHQIILSGKNSHRIAVRYCKLSSGRHSMERALGGVNTWTSGIRVLGTRATIFGNEFSSIRFAVMATGRDGLVQGNKIRFFSEDAIRITDHGTKVMYNRIADSIKTGGDGAHLDAIQLIPPQNRYTGGELRNVAVIGNQIRAAEKLPAWQQGILQGIFGSDGYFIDCDISRNTVTVNSDHGITLNGARNLVAQGNRIYAVGKPGYVPGIKLYYTRYSQNGRMTYMAGKPYSITVQGNIAPVFNVPSTYRVSDKGNNFAARSTVGNRGGVVSFARSRGATDRSTTTSESTTKIAIGVSVGVACVAAIAVVAFIAGKRASERRTFQDAQLDQNLL